MSEDVAVSDVTRTWSGVDRTKDATNWNFCTYMQNVSIYTDGELWRRPGYQYFGTQSGNSIVSFTNAFNQPFAVFADGTGTITAVNA